MKDRGGLLCDKCRHDLVVRAMALQNGVAAVWCEELGNVLIGQVTAGRFVITDVHLHVSPATAAAALEPLGELVQAHMH